MPSARDYASCKHIPEIISELVEIRSEVTKITETVYKVKIAFAQLASRYLILAAGEKCQGVREGEKEMQQGWLSVAKTRYFEMRLSVAKTRYFEMRCLPIFLA